MDNYLDLENVYKPLTNIPKRDVMPYVIDGMAGIPYPAILPPRFGRLPKRFVDRQRTYASGRIYPAWRSYRLIGGSEIRRDGIVVSEPSYLGPSGLFRMGFFSPRPGKVH